MRESGGKNSSKSKRKRRESGKLRDRPIECSRIRPRKIKGNLSRKISEV
jgi:hypothetical protein